MDLDSASASQGRAGPTRENRRGKIRDPPRQAGNNPDSCLWVSEKSDKMKLDIKSLYFSPCCLRHRMDFSVSSFSILLVSFGSFFPLTPTVVTHIIDSSKSSIPYTHTSS